MSDKLTREELKSFLKEAANLLRGKIDSSDFKHYILGLLFYKRLSDVFDEEYNKIKTQYGETLAKNKDLYGEIFYIPEDCSWKDVLKTSKNIGEKINDTFEKITRENGKRLEGILNRIDFNDKQILPDETVSNLVNHFNQHNLGNENVSGDLLGDAYEYLIAQFADDAGKKGGEFYTPHKIVELLIKILKPDEGQSVYDPACGSGGMLIEAGKYLQDNNKNALKLFMYGQENIYNTYVLARMNMILHGFNDAKIEQGDTFINPQFFNDDKTLKQFDIVIANPPWNLKNWMHNVKTINNKQQVVDIEDKYNRLTFGRPPASSGDWAWVQHMFASTTEKGKLGIVLDNGVLFRGNKEAEARKQFVENDLIEAVIGLPANLFANTGSPGCLLIINRDKPQERKNKIIFIDASKDYLEGKAQNHLREEDVKKTLETYETYEAIEKYCSVCELSEVKENDYNLNISRYVDTTEEEISVNIPDVLKNLKTLESKRAEINIKLAGFLQEVGY